MQKQFIKIFKNILLTQKGSALVPVLAFSIIATLTLYGVASLNATNSALVGNEIQKSKSKYGAEAAMKLAVRKWRNSTSNPPPLGTMVNGFILNGNNYSCVAKKSIYGSMFTDFFVDGHNTDGKVSSLNWYKISRGTWGEYVQWNGDANWRQNSGGFGNRQFFGQFHMNSSIGFTKNASNLSSSGVRFYGGPVTTANDSMENSWPKARPPAHYMYGVGISGNDYNHGVTQKTVPSGSENHENMDRIFKCEFMVVSSIEGPSKFSSDSLPPTTLFSIPESLTDSFFYVNSKMLPKSKFTDGHGMNDSGIHVTDTKKHYTNDWYDKYWDKQKVSISDAYFYNGPILILYPTKAVYLAIVQRKGVFVWHTDTIYDIGKSVKNIHSKHELGIVTYKGWQNANKKSGLSYGLEDNNRNLTISTDSGKSIFILGNVFLEGYDFTLNRDEFGNYWGGIDTSATSFLTIASGSDVMRNQKGYISWRNPGTNYNWNNVIKNDSPIPDWITVCATMLTSDDNCGERMIGTKKGKNLYSCIYGSSVNGSWFIRLGIMCAFIHDERLSNPANQGTGTESRFMTFTHNGILHKIADVNYSSRLMGIDGIDNLNLWGKN